MLLKQLKDKDNILKKIKVAKFLVYYNVKVQMILLQILMNKKNMLKIHY